SARLEPPSPGSEYVRYTLWSVAYFGDRKMPSNPPCPWCNTAGTFVTGVFVPCWVTSHTAPGFSVMSIRPSGRNAMRQGRLKVATCVIVKGVLASGCFVPALTCAHAGAGSSALTSAALNIVFMCLLYE